VCHSFSLFTAFKFPLTFLTSLIFSLGGKDRGQLKKETKFYAIFGSTTMHIACRVYAEKLHKVCENRPQENFHQQF
jgi:hypothetical protein